MTERNPAIDPALRFLLRQIPVRTLTQGEVLFQQGDEAVTAFYVLAGQFTIATSTEAGHEIEFRASMPGTLVGLEVLCRKQYHSTARCARRSRVVAVPRKELKRVLAANPKLASDVLFQMTEELCDTRDRLVNVCARSATQRVARYVLLQSAGGKLPVHLPWGSRSQIAKALSIKQETFSRLIHQLNHRGVLRIEKNLIRVLDSKGLEDVAG